MTHPRAQVSSEQRFWTAIRRLEFDNKFRIKDILESRQSLTPLLDEWLESTAMPDARHSRQALLATRQEEHLSKANEAPQTLSTQRPRRITKQRAIRILWRDLQAHSWQLKMSYDAKRRIEVEQFCVRAAYQLGMKEAPSWYREVRAHTDWLTRILFVLAIPTWRIQSRFA